MVKKSCNTFVLFILVILLALCAITGFSTLSTPSYALAEEVGDDLGGSEEDSASEDDEGVADFIRKHRAMTDEQLQTASETISPITNKIGYLIGGIVTLTAFLIFLITALDLLYIGFPPIRSLLYPGGQQQGGAMGGMGMGMGMRGGYGMGGMGGMQGGATQSTRQWVSDEAVACAALLGGGQQGGAMGGMGMGMGMGAMGGMNPQQQPQTAKSVIGTYFKKRIVFMVLFGLCIVVLLSSALLGTGANLALWFLRLIGTVNGNVPN